MKRMRIRESLGTVEVEQVKEFANKGVFQEGVKKILKPKIEAIHAGLTRNKTYYPADKLKGDPSLGSGVYSWTRPYPKPMIKNHNVEEEPLGRVEDAYFVAESLTGPAHIVVIPTLTSEDAIEKVQDGRYMTVSIGAETDSVTCSICGANLMEEEWGGFFHEHQRGEIYDGKEAYWIIGNIWFDELSFVNVPADTQAMVTDKGVVEEPTMVEGDKTASASENLILDLDTGKFVNVQESADAHVVRLRTDIDVDDTKSRREDNTVEETREVKTEVTESEETPVEPEVTEPEVAEGETTPVEESSEDETQAEIADLQAQIADLTDKLAQAEEQANKVPDLESKIAELESQLSEATSERDALLSENADLKAEKHRALAEKVVDLKIDLNKIPAEQREEAVQAHISRTAESLTDSLSDLLTESGSGAVVGNIGKVENPGYAKEDAQDSKTEGNLSEQKDELTPEQALKGLLLGLGRK